MQPFQQLKHGPSILLVQISGGFICQQHGRFGDKRPSDRDTLLFPSGKLPCAVVGSICEPYFREPLPRFFQRGSEILAAQQQRHSHIFCGCKIRQ